MGGGNQNILAGEELMKFWLLEMGMGSLNRKKANGGGALTVVGSLLQPLLHRASAFNSGKLRKHITIFFFADLLGDVFI